MLPTDLFPPLPPPPPPPPHPPRHPPRLRSRKHKNGPKKQPQRGLGVAQLEKLRLQEQSKLHEAACLASLHHHLPPLSDSLPISDHHQLHQQAVRLKPASFHVTTIPHQQHQQQEQMQPRRVSLPLSTQFNCGGNGANSFLAFPALTLAAPSRKSLPIGMTQQGMEENEPCLSSLSQVLDLCSPRSSTSGTVSLNEQSSSQASPLRDKGKRFIMDESRGMNARFNSPSFLSNILTGQAQTGTGPMQIQETGRQSQIPLGNAKEPATSFFPVTEPSKGKEMQCSVGAQEVQNQGGPLLFTDLRLFDYSLGPSSNARNQSRNREEASVTNTSPAGAESVELSSFQTNACDECWSFSDQISGRKRPWLFMQEATRNLVDLKAMFLNALVGENQTESKNQDSPDNDTNLVRMNETYTPTSIYRTRPDFGSIRENLPLQLCSLSSNFRKECFSKPLDPSAFLNSIHYEQTPKIETNDFLTLGLSGSFCGMHEQPTLNTNHQGQRYTRNHIGKLEEVQVQYGDAAVTAKRSQNPCPEQENPLMVSTFLSTGEEFCSSIQLRTRGEATIRSYTSKAMSEEQQQQEEEENRSVTCLDLNLKLSL